MQNIQLKQRVMSPGELARSLGVSESSVKRWVDEGLLEATRTAGGHRRIALPEAVRFIRQTGTEVARPDLMVGLAAVPRLVQAAGVDIEAEADRLHPLLEGDDAAAARTLLVSLYMAGWPVAAICDGPMRIALDRIGRLWEHGPGGIVVEHRATDTCIQALADMRSLAPPLPADAPVAIGGAPDGDPYLVPSMMAATVLTDLGYRAGNLGPETPGNVLREAVRSYRPRIVWLAISVTGRQKAHRKSAMELAAELAPGGGMLIAGGRGAPALPLGTAGYLRVESMAELAAFARGALTAA